MKKKYNISSKSDMKRLGRDLEKDFLNSVEAQIKKSKHDIPCPHCEREITIQPGINRCPYCHYDVDLRLNLPDFH